MLRHVSMRAGATRRDPRRKLASPQAAVACSLPRPRRYDVANKQPASPHILFTTNQKARVLAVPCEPISIDTFGCHSVTCVDLWLEWREKVLEFGLQRMPADEALKRLRITRKKIRQVPQLAPAPAS